VAKLGLYISTQANFFSLLGDGFMEAFGPVRSQELYRFKTLLQKGVRLGFSSDCPVAEPNPLIGLRDAICRKTAKKQDFGPAECLTAEQAVSLYTREAAYFSFEEGERGTLKEGKAADLVVLDGDPMQTPPESIPEINVKMTMVGGRIVYDGR
jgi:predicted amidohydrolase YtcJ